MSRMPICLLAVMSVGVSACGSGTDPVRTFPIPGTRVASPQTQIAFRGVPAGQVRNVVVRGSSTGVHAGGIEADSDGQGASFIPAKPFAPGEQVTVSSPLQVEGASRRTWRFTVATPAGAIPSQPLNAAPRIPGDALSFSSRPDLTPPAVEVTRESPSTATGEIFLTPQQGPLQNGAMIVGPDGNLIWFHPVQKGDMAADLRVQRYQGKPVLTWWQGYSGAGLGQGVDVIDDASYRTVAVVHAANGLEADLHEFEITPRGTALLTAYYPIYWDASSIGGSKRQIVFDSVVQEIDIKTGLLLFQWDSLDHVPLNDSYEQVPKSAGSPFDYFHVNSVDPDGEGNMIISGRNTWAAYNVDSSGRTTWQLGGKHSSFKLGSGARFAFQHAVRTAADDHQTITLFDNGAGPPPIHPQSRGLTLKLDRTTDTVTLLRSTIHSPSLLADFEGNVQSLGSGNQMLGWGQQPYFTEYDPDGQIVFEGRFVDANSSYRAYRFRWTATPSTQPSIAATTTSDTTTVYASWNGATTVGSWRVLAGSTSTALSTVATVPEEGFETEISIPAAGYVAIQAIASDGRVLSTSTTITPS
ncbi:hypothetical protein AYO39_03340 [Actinobacteria bacterium SCGC AG-212-D09]|nr:hypothetical protein AYO39_03340 [Actinobacteria bacterium SCGC AG-212-D09]